MWYFSLFPVSVATAQSVDNRVVSKCLVYFLQQQDCCHLLHHLLCSHPSPLWTSFGRRWGLEPMTLSSEGTAEKMRAGQCSQQPQSPVPCCGHATALSCASATVPEKQSLPVIWSSPILDWSSCKGAFQKGLAEDIPDFRWPPHHLSWYWQTKCPTVLQTSTGQNQDLRKTFAPLKEIWQLTVSPLDDHLCSHHSVSSEKHWIFFKENLFRGKIWDELQMWSVFATTAK